MTFRSWILARIRYIKPSFFSLQWGHDLSVMDTSSRSSPSFLHRPFNGAMTFRSWIRGAGPGRGFQQGRPFNGAMTFRSWILAQPLPCDTPGQVLQWGHDLSVMDTTTVTAAGLGSGLPFNGAMTFRSWIQYLENVFRHREPPMCWNYMTLAGSCRLLVDRNLPSSCFTLKSCERSLARRIPPEHSQ